MSDATQAPAATKTEPQTREEHMVRAMALGELLVRTVTASAESPRVVFDALLNVYLNAAHHYGLQVEAGQILVQAGGNILLGTALTPAPDADPLATPPTVH